MAKHAAPYVRPVGGVRVRFCGSPSASQPSTAIRANLHSVPKRRPGKSPASARDRTASAGILEKRSNLLERQHLVSALFGSVRDLDSPDGNRTSTRGQPIGKEFTDHVLFMTPGRVSEAVEGGGLISRQPDE